MKTEEIYRDFDNKLFKLEIKLGELCDNKYKVSYKDIFEEITNVRLDIRNQMNLCTSPEDSGHIFTEGMKITPERAKEVEEGIRWWKGEDNLTSDQALTYINELRDLLNTEQHLARVYKLQAELANDQLAKQEVAFRETVKLHFEEKRKNRNNYENKIQLLKNRLKELGDISPF